MGFQPISHRQDADATSGDRRGRSCLPRIERRLVGKRFGWNLGSDAPVIADAHDAVVGYATNFRARHVPLIENFAHDIFLAAFGDDQHSLLRFAQKNFIRRHARLAFWNFGEVDLNSSTATAGRFAGGTSQPGRAHVLNSGDCVAGQKFQTCLEQKLFLERIAHLDGGTILLRFFGQLSRREGRAGQSITSSLRTDVENRIAHAARGATCELFVSQNAETENIDQRIAFETFVEINFAADRWNADAVAVVRNAGDNSGEDAAIGGEL